VTKIGEHAFSGCKNLKAIVIPASVTLIDNWAFVYCASLDSIVVSEGNKVYDSRDNCNAIIETENNLLLVGCNTTTVPETVTTIGVSNTWRGVSSAFKGRTGLTSIVIPESVTEIGRETFRDCTGLKTIVIKGKLKKIPEDVFRNCTALETITLPAGISKIDTLAFKGCTALKTVYVPAKKSDYYKQRLESCQQFNQGEGPVWGTIDELVVELPAEKKKK